MPPPPSTARYPVTLDLTGQPVLVVGAGPVAVGKVERLVAAGARVTVVAPRAVPAIAHHPEARWVARPYVCGEAAHHRFVVTCTGRPEVDGEVFRDGEATGVFVNAADDLDHCSAILPAVARHGDISVAVGTAGRSPAFASWYRRRVEADLADGLGDLLDLLAAVRLELRAARGSTEHPGWATALDDGVPELVRSGDVAAARVRLRRHLGLATPNRPAGPIGRAAA